MPAKVNVPLPILVKFKTPTLLWMVPLNVLAVLFVPTFRVPAVADLLSIVPVPVSPEIVGLKPLRSKTPGVYTHRSPLPVSGVAELSGIQVALPAWSTPLLTVVMRICVLAPLKRSVDALPLLKKPPQLYHR